MGDLVLRDLGGVLANVRGFEVHGVTADDPAMLALTGGELVRQAVAVDRVGVELRLEVLEVQREVQDRTVARRGRRQRGSRTYPGQRRGADYTKTGNTCATQEVSSVGVILGAPLDHVANHLLTEHQSSKGSLPHGGSTVRRRRDTARHKSWCCKVWRLQGFAFIWLGVL